MGATGAGYLISAKVAAPLFQEALRPLSRGACVHEALPLWCSACHPWVMLLGFKAPGEGLFAASKPAWCMTVF